MNVYIDTSVLVSAFSPNDEHHDDSRSLMTLPIKKLGSPYTVLELCCVVSRELRRGKIQLPPYTELNRLTHEERVLVIVRYIIESFNLEIPPLAMIETTLSPLPSVTCASEVATALYLAPRLCLPVSAVLHIGSVAILKRLGHRVDAIVTTDPAFLELQPEIKSSVGVDVVTPRDLLRRLGV